MTCFDCGKVFLIQIINSNHHPHATRFQMFTTRYGGMLLCGNDCPSTIPFTPPVNPVRPFPRPAEPPVPEVDCHCELTCVIVCLCFGMCSIERSIVSEPPVCCATYCEPQPKRNLPLITSHLPPINFSGDVLPNEI